MSMFIDLTLEHIESLYGDSDILDFAETNPHERLERIQAIYQQHKDDLDAKDILDVYEGVHEMLVASSKRAWKSREKAAQKSINAAKRINNNWRGKQRL